MKTLTILCLACSVLACGEESTAVTEDIGRSDAVTVDSTLPDSALPDAAFDSTVTPDSGVVDAATPDGDLPDTSPLDSAVPEVDRTDEVFAKDHLIQVQVQIDEADWDALRFQGRSRADITGPGCQEGPFPSPYDWFHAQVTVDGVVYEDVGIRKKGFIGSLSQSRPSLKVRLNKYVDDQKHLGLSRLTLNNQRQDPSKLRSCLTYHIFEQVGLPAPRCNFAQVVVNGRPMGIYAHVESLKRPFLARHFEDNSGHLYEGTLSDFREEWRGSFEQKFDEENPHTAPIDALADAVMVDDADLLDTLGATLDLEAFFKFWATEVMVAHWDGYAGNTNNFWFYEDPGSGRVHFIPWGPDATFKVPRLLFEGRRAPWSVLATGIIARRLYLLPEGQQRYLAELRSLLETVWDPDALAVTVDEWARVIRPGLFEDELGTNRADIAQIKEFLSAQRDRVLGEINNGPVVWDVPIRGNICAEEVGQASITFETTWGTWPTQDTFQTGTGTYDVTGPDGPLEVVAVGGAIGMERDEALLVVPGLTQDQTIYFFALNMPPAWVRPGQIDLDDISCALGILVMGRPQEIAWCPRGTLTFEAASTENGAPVRGAFQAGLWARDGE